METYLSNTDGPYVLFRLVGTLILPATLAGCGNPMPNCTPTSLEISPTTATADHLAASPGNKAQFGGFNAPPASCSVIANTAALWTDLKWTSSDPASVTIGNTVGVDYGIATCSNATSGPVTITATGQNDVNATISGTASLTCK